MTLIVTILWLLFGAGLAALFIWRAKQGSYNAYLQTVGIGLIVAALIYIAFAFIWGDFQWVLYESAGALIYTIIAVIGMRQRSATMLAFGWLAHVLWDTLLHLWGPGHHIAPDWYAMACLSFDIVVALHIFTYKSLQHKTQMPLNGEQLHANSRD